MLAADAGASGLWHGCRSGCTPQLHPWVYKGWCLSYQCPIASLQTSDSCLLQGSFQQVIPTLPVGQWSLLSQVHSPKLPSFLPLLYQIPISYQQSCEFWPKPIASCWLPPLLLSLASYTDICMFACTMGTAYCIQTAPTHDYSVLFLWKVL